MQLLIYLFIEQTTEIILIFLLYVIKASVEVTNHLFIPFQGKYFVKVEKQLLSKRW